MSQQLLTARQVAALLGVCPETVRRYTERGELPAVRLPGTVRGRLRYRRDDLETWLAEHEDGGAGPRSAKQPIPAPPSPGGYTLPRQVTPPRQSAASTEEDSSDATR
jgi:excisionase family DNA binding protein